MASELAETIFTKHLAQDLGEGGLIRIVDVELQKVREVLASFGSVVLTGSKGLCFGAFGSTCNDFNHSGRCQRARVLMEKLNLKEK
jgi:hypothetical protein